MTYIMLQRNIQQSPRQSTCILMANMWLLLWLLTSSVKCSHMLRRNMCGAVLCNGVIHEPGRAGHAEPVPAPL